jgi:prepilin-type N-terminal cleavage/methylation domain-containing protein
MPRHTRERGFSLLELLIVVAIILIIAAIAIPNMQRAKMAANETAAVAGMHTIFIAEAAYDAAGWNNPTAVGFSAKLQDLGDAGGCNPPSVTSACQLDNVMANATSPSSSKSGYYFTYTPVTSGGKNIAFILNGDPVLRGSSGQRSFFVDESGVTRANYANVATVNDNPVQ